MSILTRTRPQVKPTPTESTRVLFDATRRTVSPHFGLGILPSCPTFRAPAPFEDMQWAAEYFGRTTVDYDVVELEARAAESAALDRLEMGLCC